jgi:mono/diheme cytochrome c family protein
MIAVAPASGCSKKQEQVPVERKPAQLPDAPPPSGGGDDQKRFPFDRDPDTSNGNDRQATGSGNANVGGQGSGNADPGPGSDPNSGSGNTNGNSTPGGNISTNGASGNSGGPGSSTTTTASVGYIEHVKPIFDRACVRCHTTGGSRAQSPLENYNNARTYGDLAQQLIDSGRMPPPADPKLSEQDKKIVKDWVAAGKPERASTTNSSSGSSNNGPTVPSDAQLMGTWTGEQDESSAKWAVISQAPAASTPNNPSAGSGGTNPPTGNGNATGNSGLATPPTATVVSYEKEVKAILERSCVSCHRPGGSYAQVPLHTFAAVRQRSARVNARVQAGTMPRGGLDPSERAVIDKWLKDGALERVPAAGSATEPGRGQASPSGSTGQPVTEFRIKPGTGSGAWNTKETEVVVKVGTRFTIFNDDTVPHRWHTDGAPCPHGNVIQPGGSETCTVSQPYSGTPVLYDHNTRGQFFIRAER